MGTGFAIQAVNALMVFPAVARVAREEKANLLGLGLCRGGLAVPTGLVVGGLLCVLGGVTRSFFSDEPQRSASPE